MNYREEINTTYIIKLESIINVTSTFLNFFKKHIDMHLSFHIKDPKFLRDFLKS